MDYLPVGLRVAGRTCLLVGGGEAAVRKAQLLARAGAHLRVVAEQCDPVLQGRSLTERSRIEWLARRYRSEDLQGVVAVVVAEQDAQLQAQVAHDAGQRAIPLNVVDVPQLCTFVMPALVDREPIVVSILSAGAAPVLARRLRGQIEALLPERLGALASMLQRYRPEIKRKLPDLSQRRDFFERLLDGPIPELVYDQEMAAAEASLQASLDGHVAAKGMAYLIAVGPGDPELLTLRAQRLMQQADRVLYDVQVTAAILERCRRDAHLETWAVVEGGVQAAADAEPYAAGRVSPELTWAARLAACTAMGERVAVLVPGAWPDPTGQGERACTAVGIFCEQVRGIAP